MNLSYEARLDDPGAPAAGRRTGVGIARVMTGVIALCTAFLVWREFEPLMFFRPIDGVVVWSVVDGRRVTGRTLTARHVPQIGYRYVVDGKRFVSWEYRRTSLTGTRAGAARVASGYVVGARARAWYNPFDPADSVLKREPELLLFALLGILWLGVARAFRR